jgi:tetratricopeptide (TPR) repeat protein
VVLVGVLAALGLVAVVVTGAFTWQGRLPDMRPVPYPDLSRLDPETRRILGARREALDRMCARHGAPRADLAEAFGETARFYLAARLFAAAEPCLVNARALAPRAFGWTYLLGHLYRMTGRREDAIEAFVKARQLRPEDPFVGRWLERLTSSPRGIPPGRAIPPGADGSEDSSLLDPALRELDLLLPHSRPGAAHPSQQE